jgi:DNA-binding HxlR family transcriptional regulator
MALPIPGSPVRGSKTGKPIMALFDLVGRTWSLGIIWQLRECPLSFSELQNKCENISPTLLTNRLKELQATYLVERCLEGYQLTSQGADLYAVIAPLGLWAKNWQSSFILQGVDNE